MSAGENREKSLVAEALRYQSIEAQNAFLDGVCGKDQKLRERLEGGLQTITGAGSADDSSTGPIPVTTGVKLPVTEEPGEYIGPYKLLQKLGEGGFGVVYVAEQTKPVLRRVALKVIKLGMDTRAVIARFEAERQALALMDHPHIAKVLDAGATKTGRPYFVMELVKGLPINEYCDRAELNIKQRLELFILVCKAIQHAHQKGIIHRDLKPTNILVSDGETGPVPKIIDFGIAKAADHKLTDKTLFTTFEQFIGTPAYVSPEQAEMSKLDVDTRTDIYSLGVLLYELLTGQTPFESRKLLDSGMDEMRRRIREEDPPEPSKRLTVLSRDELTKVAAKHQVQPERFRSLLQGDLDWIVMMALEKDRNHRYPTANGLARDIERHLHHEPVNAAAQTTSYRLKKWIRRHRVGFLSAMAILLASALATVISTVQGMRASIAATQATNERDRARIEEGKAWLERANGFLEEKNFFYAKLMAGKAIGFHDFGRERMTQAAQDQLLQLLPSGHPKAHEAALWLRGADDYAFVWKSPVTKHHQQSIDTLAWSRDGRWIVSASKDGSARLWDRETGDQHVTLVPGCGPLASAAFSSDGARVALGSEGGCAHIFDILTGNLLKKLTGHHDDVYSLAFSPSGSLLVSADKAGTVWLWHGDTYEPIMHTTVDGSALRSIAFHPDGSKFAVGGALGRVTVLDAGSGRLQLRYMAHERPIYSLAYSPTGGRLATGSGDHTISLWNAETGDWLSSLKGHGAEVRHVAFNEDGSRLVSSSLDTTNIIWDVTGPGAIANTLSDGARAYSAAFHPNGSQLAVGGASGRIQLWDARSGSVLNQAEGHAAFLRFVGFHPGGRQLVSADESGKVLVWNLADGSVANELKTASSSATRCASLNPSGNLLAIGMENGHIQCWDLALGRLLNDCQPEDSPVSDLVFTPDGRRIVAGCSSGALMVLDARTGKIETRIKQAELKQVLSIDVSPDGSLLASSFESKESAFLWKLPSGELARELKGHTRTIPAVCFSPDGSLLASGDRNGNIRLVEVATGEFRRDFSGQSGGIVHLEFSLESRFLLASDPEKMMMWDTETHERSALFPVQGTPCQAAFSPEGSLVAAATEQGSIQIWEMANAQVEFVFPGHNNVVRSLAFDPNGRKLVGGGDDHVLKIWDLDTGQLRQNLQGHSRDVFCTDWSPDGTRIASCDRAGIIRIWDARTGALQVEVDEGVEIRKLAFSPDGTKVAICSDLGQLRLLDAGTGEHLSKFIPEEEAQVLSVAFTRKGDYLASGNDVGDIYLWNSATGRLEARMKDEIRQILNLAFSPDGQWLAAVGGGQPQVRIWDVVERKQIATFNTGRERARAVAFSPDGKILAAGGFDATVYLWNTQTQELLATSLGHSREIYDLVFSPDGRLLASSSEDTMIRLWDVDAILNRKANFATYLSWLNIEGNTISSRVPPTTDNLFTAQSMPIQSFSGKSLVAVLKGGLTGEALDRELFRRFVRAGNLRSASLILEQYQGDGWRQERKQLNTANLATPPSLP